MAAATRVANVAVLFCACPACLHQAASMGEAESGGEKRPSSYRLGDERGGPEDATQAASLNRW